MMNASFFFFRCMTFCLGGPPWPWPYVWASTWCLSSSSSPPHLTAPSLFSPLLPPPPRPPPLPLPLPLLPQPPGLPPAHQLADMPMTMYGRGWRTSCRCWRPATTWQRSWGSWRDWPSRLWVLSVFFFCVQYTARVVVGFVGFFVFVLWVPHDGMSGTDCLQTPHSLTLRVTLAGQMRCFAWLML